MSIVESLPTYGVHYYAVKVQIYYSPFYYFAHTHSGNVSKRTIPELEAVFTLSFYLCLTLCTFLSFSYTYTNIYWVILCLCASGQAGDSMVVGSELQRHFSVWPSGQSQTQEGELMKCPLHSFRPLFQCPLILLSCIWIQAPRYFCDLFYIFSCACFLAQHMSFLYSVTCDLVFWKNSNSAVHILLYGDTQSRNALLPVLLLFCS